MKTADAEVSQAHRHLRLQQQHPRWVGQQTDLPAVHRCCLHGNAGSPNKSPAVCAQPHPLSTDTPAAANQLVAREWQAWCVKSVCVFLRVCVWTETHPQQVDPVKGRSGAPVELGTQKKKEEETFVSRRLLRELVQLVHLGPAGPSGPAGPDVPPGNPGRSILKL